LLLIQGTLNLNAEAIAKKSVREKEEEDKKTLQDKIWKSLMITNSCVHKFICSGNNNLALLRNVLFVLIKSITLISNKKMLLLL
jgi:hypothetical protein